MDTLTGSNYEWKGIQHVQTVIQCVISRIHCNRDWLCPLWSYIQQTDMMEFLIPPFKDYNGPCHFVLLIVCSIALKCIKRDSLGPNILEEANRPYSRAPLDSEKFAKNREEEGENQEKTRKSGKNREGSFTLPLLTDRAGYATALLQNFAKLDSFHKRQTCLQKKLKETDK